MAVKCGKGHGYHESSAVVRACYNGGDAPLVDMGVTATDELRATRKQAEYLASLLTKHGLKSAKDPVRYGKREISPIISLLRQTPTSQEISKEDLTGFGLEYEDGASLAPGKPRDYTAPSAIQAAKPAAPKVELEAGIYLLNDVVYKVQRAVHGSGHMYAKQLKVVDGHGKFMMAPGAIFKLRTEHKMSLEQAKKFGAIYGVCCVCGRTLTDEDSIADGIGPVCGGKMAA